MDNIVISSLVDSDRSAVYDLLQDALTMRFLGPRRPLTDEESEAWFVRELKAEQRFAFRSAETQEIVGFCGVTLIDGERDFGYFIRRQFWGQGLAVLMCKAAIDKLAQTLDVTQVKVFIAADNIASQKVAKRLGWQRKGAAEHDFELGHVYQIRP